MMNFIGRACLVCLFVFLNLLLRHVVCLSGIQDCVSSAALVLCLDVFTSSVKQLRCQVTFLDIKFFKYSEYEKMPNDVAMDYYNKNT